MNETATPGPLWRRLIGFNLLSGIVLMVVGFYFGWWLGHQIHAESLEYFADTNQNDIALMLGYLCAVIGFLIGLGFARYPLSRMLGRQRTVFENEEGGVGRYFGLCTDHKVVGIQYLFGIGLFFFIAGLNAMLIRTELLQPSPQVFNAGNYLTLVGLHGTMMMGMMTSGILGPFGNYFIPLMIGSRRMAFPRVEALTFWLLMAAGVILVSTIFFGGFPTGWTGYAPLNDQANYGFDSYIFFFALVGVSMTLLGLNLITTIVTMRAPGLTWSRLPIFCWGALSTSILMVLAAPVLIAALLMVALDRGLQTSFFLSSAGGSPYLFQNLFWFFGHPEVIGNRQRHRHLAIGLLAELTAILVVHADRMLALLGERGASMIHASTGPLFSIAGSTVSRTLASTSSSDQVALATNAATTGAVPPSALEPSAPPSARRSCAPQAASGPCNSRAVVSSAPRDRSRFQDRLHTPQTAFRYLHPDRRFIWPSARQILNLLNCLILSPK